MRGSEGRRDEVGLAWAGEPAGARGDHTVSDFHHVWAAEAIAGLIACLAIAVTTDRGTR